MTSVGFVLNSPQISSNLGVYIERQLINRFSRADSKTRILVRRILQTAGLSIVAIGRSGVMMLCLDGAANILGKEVNDPAVLGLGISNGIGNIVAFGVLSTYTTLELIEELTRSVAPEEAKLITSKVGSCARRVIGASSLIIGLLAQVPTAYAAYRSAFYAPAFNYIAQQLDCGRTAFSTFKTLEGVTEMQRASRNSVEATLIRSRKDFRDKISHCRKLLSFGTEERGMFLQTMNNFPNIGGLEEGYESPLVEVRHDEKSYQEYLKDILDFSDLPGELVPSFFKKGGVILEICVILMTLAVLAETFQLTRAGAASIDGSEAFSSIAGTVVVLASTHIVFSLIRKSTRVAMDSFQGKSLTPITRELMPRTYKVLTFVGIACSFSTFVPEIFFAKLYFPEWAVSPVGGLASLGTVFMGIGAVRSLRDLIIRCLTRRRECNLLLETDEQLQRLHTVLGAISSEEYGRFIVLLLPSIQNRLICPDLFELNSYLSEKNLLLGSSLAPN